MGDCASTQRRVITAWIDMLIAPGLHNHVERSDGTFVLILLKALVILQSIHVLFVFELFWILFFVI